MPPWRLLQLLVAPRRFEAWMARRVERGVRPMMYGWFPIETAPKDGTWIQVWSPDIDDGEPGGFTTKWADGRWEWQNRMWFACNQAPTLWRPASLDADGVAEMEEFYRASRAT